MKIMIFRLIIFLVVFLVPAGNLLAEVELELQVPDESLVLGDEMTLQLKADGVDGDAKLILPDVPGLSFRQLGRPSSSSQTVIVNGKVNRFSGLIYNIGISGQRKGQFDVPGLKLIFDNKTYRSRPFTLRVVSPDAQSGMKVTLSASRQQVYPGESLVITLKWYLQDSVKDYSFRFSLLEQKDRLRLQLAEVSGAAATRELNLNGYNIPFRQGSETLDGESYTVYETALEVFPPDPGALQIPAASVKAMVQRGTELKRDFFDRLVRAPKLQRIFAVSEPLTVHVAELPADGRPKWFTGGVGQFEIQTSADQSRVKIGDPIELSIRVGGQGLFTRIEQPVLNDIPEFKENFAISDNLQPGDIAENSITFRQVIRARAESVSSIPPVRFAYFDPVQKRYITLESSRIPIKVLPSKQITAADIIKPEESSTAGSAPVLRRKRGIYGNYTFEDALTSQESHPAWFGVFLVPPTGYLLVLVWVRRRRRLNNDQALSRSRTAMGNAGRRIKKVKKLLDADSGAFLAELSGALSSYISDKFNLGAGELTVYDIRQLLSKHTMSEESAESLVTLFETIDRLRFSSRDATREERQRILEEVEQSLHQLEKQL